MSSFIDEQKDEVEAVESIYSEEIEMLSDDPIRFVDIGIFYKCMKYYQVLKVNHDFQSYHKFL